MRLQILIYPSKTPRVNAPALYSFLEISSSERTLEELAIQIEQRHAKLYPHKPKLTVYKLQDYEGNDLDLSFQVGDVFSDKSSDSNSSIVRVVQAAGPNRESSIPPESGLRPRIGIKNLYGSVLTGGQSGKTGSSLRTELSYSQKLVATRDEEIVGREPKRRKPLRDDEEVLDSSDGRHNRFERDGRWGTTFANQAPADESRELESSVLPGSSPLRNDTPESNNGEVADDHLRRGNSDQSWTRGGNVRQPPINRKLFENRSPILGEPETPGFVYKRLNRPNILQVPASQISGDLEVLAFSTNNGEGLGFTVKEEVPSSSPVLSTLDVQKRTPVERIEASKGRNLVELIDRSVCIPNSSAVLPSPQQQTPSSSQRGPSSVGSISRLTRPSPSLIRPSPKTKRSKMNIQRSRDPFEVPESTDSEIQSEGGDENASNTEEDGHTHSVDLTPSAQLLNGIMEGVNRQPSSVQATPVKPDEIREVKFRAALARQRRDLASGSQGEERSQRPGPSTNQDSKGFWNREAQEKIAKDARLQEVAQQEAEEAARIGREKEEAVVLLKKQNESEAKLAKQKEDGARKAKEKEQRDRRAEEEKQERARKAKEMKEERERKARELRAEKEEKQRLFRELKEQKRKETEKKAQMKKKEQERKTKAGKTKQAKESSEVDEWNEKETTNQIIITTIPHTTDSIGSTQGKQADPPNASTAEIPAPAVAPTKKRGRKASADVEEGVNAEQILSGSDVANNKRQKLKKTKDNVNSPNPPISRAEHRGPSSSPKLPLHSSIKNPASSNMSPPTSSNNGSLEKTQRTVSFAEELSVKLHPMRTTRSSLLPPVESDDSGVDRAALKKDGPKVVRRTPIPPPTLLVPNDTPPKTKKKGVLPVATKGELVGKKVSSQTAIEDIEDNHTESDIVSKKPRSKIKGKEPLKKSSAEHSKRTESATITSGSPLGSNLSLTDPQRNEESGEGPMKEPETQLPPQPVKKQTKASLLGTPEPMDVTTDADNEAEREPEVEEPEEENLRKQFPHVSKAPTPPPMDENDSDVSSIVSSSTSSDTEDDSDTSSSKSLPFGDRLIDRIPSRSPTVNQSTQSPVAARARGSNIAQGSSTPSSSASSASPGAERIAAVLNKAVLRSSGRVTRQSVNSTPVSKASQPDAHALSSSQKYKPLSSMLVDDDPAEVLGKNVTSHAARPAGSQLARPSINREQDTDDEDDDDESTSSEGEGDDGGKNDSDSDSSDGGGDDIPNDKKASSMGNSSQTTSGGALLGFFKRRSGNIPR